MAAKMIAVQSIPYARSSGPLTPVALDSYIMPRPLREISHKWQYVEMAMCRNGTETNLPGYYYSIWVAACSMLLLL